jgi:hypothetical protein
MTRVHYQPNLRALDEEIFIANRIYSDQSNTSVAGSSEHGNKPWGSIKSGEFLD